jgi:hypothetical protein
MREQTPVLSAAQQEANAIRYLSFVEGMAKFGRISCLALDHLYEEVLVKEMFDILGP